MEKYDIIKRTIRVKTTGAGFGFIGVQTKLSTMASVGCPKKQSGKSLYPPFCGLANKYYTYMAHFVPPNTPKIEGMMAKKLDIIAFFAYF